MAKPWTREELERMDRETSRPLFSEVVYDPVEVQAEIVRTQDKTWEELFLNVPWYSPLRWCLCLLALPWIQSNPKRKAFMVWCTEHTRGYKVRKRTFEAS